MPTIQLAGHTFLKPEHVLKQAGLKLGQSVVDLGCGSGYFILQAARMVGEHGVAYGVDVLESALSTVASKAQMFGLTNIKLVRANVEVYGASKGIHDKTIDMVLMVQLLSQSKKWRDAIKEADRMLVDEGLLVIVDWKSNKLSFSPQQEEYVAPAEVETVANSYGLKLEREIEASPYHYGLIFRKT